MSRICANCAGPILDTEPYQVCSVCKHNYHVHHSCPMHPNANMTRYGAGQAARIPRPRISLPRVPGAPAPSVRAGSSFNFGGCLVVLVLIGLAIWALSSWVNWGGQITQVVQATNPPAVVYTEPTRAPAATKKISPTAKPTRTAAQLSCPGAPKQQLTLNEDAEVCTRHDRVFMRDGPGKRYNIVRSVPPGTVLWVKGGPECADGWSWWQVRASDGLEGWMSEGGDAVDGYFLCPN